MSRRVMARPADPGAQVPVRELALLGVVGVLAVLGLLAVSGMFANNATPPTDAPVAGQDVAAIPSANASGGTETVDVGSSRPSASRPPIGSPATPGGTDNGRSTAIPTPAATPTPTPISGAAPTSAAAFNLERQVIAIGFPLHADTRYQYRDNFLAVRDGTPDAYNHARIREDGSAVRLHDGIDIYAREGEPLLAVFDGTVIDPRTRWEPWEAQRYGQTVVIMSTEPATAGYIALYAHADRVWVEPGMEVARGQVLGTVGRTGNAEIQSVRPHLHFELRAPFQLDWSVVGELRSVDAFNPYPSLREADPKRT